MVVGTSPGGVGGRGLATSPGGVGGRGLATGVLRGTGGRGLAFCLEAT